ncbi:hypothetical protein [Lyngbya sp. CCY1209]|nr:hypothetical protein [Lyngbya sp. CCY1209]MEB3883797.1 hypothetical protein [Lyngbya sp. CCY1209]
MTNPQLQLLVEYRLLEARETLREAEILLERSRFFLGQIQEYLQNWRSEF